MYRFWFFGLIEQVCLKYDKNKKLLLDFVEFSKVQNYTMDLNIFSNFPTTFKSSNREISGSLIEKLQFFQEIAVNFKASTQKSKANSASFCEDILSALYQIDDFYLFIVPIFVRSFLRHSFTLFRNSLKLPNSQQNELEILEDFKRPPSLAILHLMSKITESKLTLYVLAGQTVQKLDFFSDCYSQKFDISLFGLAKLDKHA